MLADPSNINSLFRKEVLFNYKVTLRQRAYYLDCSSYGAQTEELAYAPHFKDHMACRDHAIESARCHFRVPTSSPLEISALKELLRRHRKIFGARGVGLSTHQQVGLPHVPRCRMVSRGRKTTLGIYLVGRVRNSCHITRRQRDRHRFQRLGTLIGLDASNKIAAQCTRSSAVSVGRWTRKSTLLILCPNRQPPDRRYPPANVATVLD